MKLSATDDCPGHCYEATLGWECHRVGEVALPPMEITRYGVVRLTLPSDPDLKQRLCDEQRMQARNR